jgi:ComF family protein
MQRLLTHALDFIFPPDAETLAVRNLTPEAVRATYRPHSVYGVTALADFHNPHIQALVHEAKFHNNERAWALLSELFLLHTQHYDVVVPIPLSRTRMRKRGYNQVHAVLHAAMQKRVLPIDTTLLTRTRETRPQTELTREARLENMRGAFTAHDPSAVTGKHILIVDDVVTTGSTLRAAHTALLPHHPASVTLLALAH